MAFLIKEHRHLTITVKLRVDINSLPFVTHINTKYCHYLHVFLNCPKKFVSTNVTPFGRQDVMGFDHVSRAGTEIFKRTATACTLEPVFNVIPLIMIK